MDFEYDDTCEIGNCGTFDDCFDRPCPRYGVAYRAVPRKGYDISQYPDQLTERQSNCRVDRFFL